MTVHVDADDGRATPVRVEVVVVDVNVDSHISVSITVANKAGSSGAISCHCERFLLVEVIAQSADPGTGEHAEDVALVVVKLRRRFTAEGEQLVEQEGLYAR